jgi:hypothetical protein
LVEIKSFESLKDFVGFDFQGNEMMARKWIIANDNDIIARKNNSKRAGIFRRRFVKKTFLDPNTRKKCVNKADCEKERRR